jgi:hypothetical protein
MFSTFSNEEETRSRARVHPFIFQAKAQSASMSIAVDGYQFLKTNDRGNLRELIIQCFQLK